MKYITKFLHITEDEEIEYRLIFDLLDPESAWKFVSEDGWEMDSDEDVSILCDRLMRNLGSEIEVTRTEENIESHSYQE